MGRENEQQCREYWIAQVFMRLKIISKVFCLSWLRRSDEMKLLRRMFPRRRSRLVISYYHCYDNSVYDVIKHLYAHFCVIIIDVVVLNAFLMAFYLFIHLICLFRSFESADIATGLGNNAVIKWCFERWRKWRGNYRRKRQQNHQ